MAHGWWNCGALGFASPHVLWNPDVTTNYALPASWNVYQQRDLSNNVVKLSGVGHVAVGVAPVILDSLPPLLTALDANSSTLTLSWPGPGSAFNLYSTTNLSPSGWLPITNAVVSNNGNFQVSVPFNNGQTFFRLSSP